MDIEKIAIVILAAGQSRRFGKKNKLLADLNGKVLAAYMADMARDIPAAKHIAITRDNSLDHIFQGFEIIHNSIANDGQGSSIALGAKAALGHPAALFLLADMPRISAIFSRFMVNKAARTTVCRANGHLLPPMLFFESDLARLTQIAPTARGKDVLGDDYDVIDLPEEMAVDIDTPDELEALSLKL